VWELGEPFDAVAQRFRDRVAPQWPGGAWLLERMRITKGRERYDHIMLNLHERRNLTMPTSSRHPGRASGFRRNRRGSSLPTA